MCFDSLRRASFSENISFSFAFILLGKIPSETSDWDRKEKKNGKVLSRKIERGIEIGI